MVMGPEGAETKNVFAGKGRLQFTGLDWSGIKASIFRDASMGHKLIKFSIYF
jgi:hypothetical protein